MTTFTMAANIRIAPQIVPPGAIVTAIPGTGGTMTVEYTQGNATDIANGVAIWTAWPKGQASTRTADLSNNLLWVRATAFTAGGALNINYNPSFVQLDEYRADFGASASGGGADITLTGGNAVGDVKTATINNGTGTVQFSRTNNTTGVTTDISGATGINTATYTLTTADYAADPGITVGAYSADYTPMAKGGKTTQSVTPPTPASTVLLVGGVDSLVAGLAGTNPPVTAYLPISVSMQAPGKTYTLKNTAVPGDTTTQALAKWDTSGGGFAFETGKDVSVYSLGGGGNDGPVTNRFLAYRNLRELFRRAKAKGYNRFIIGTIPSRDFQADADSSFSGNTLDLNIDIRNRINDDLDGDAVFDFAANAIMDTVEDASNTTYYSSDKRHFVDAGQAVQGTIHAPVLAAVVAAPTARKMAPGIWSLYDMSANLNISNSNRTLAYGPATGNSASSARCLAGVTTGKYGWETVLDNVTGSCYVGMCNRAFEPAIIARTLFLYGSPNALGYGAAAGNVQYNNTTLFNIGVGVAGDIIQCAVDLDAKLFWIRRNTGNWNNNASANPETGVGGADISGLGADVRHPAGGINTPGGQITARFAAAEQTQARPVGFSTFG